MSDTEDTVLTQEEIEKLKDIFDESDINKSGRIEDQSEMNMLIQKLADLELTLAGHEIRTIIETKMDGAMYLQDLHEIFIENSPAVKARQRNKATVQKRTGLKEAGGTSGGSAEGTKHSHSHAETEAFVDWINASLANDPWYKKKSPGEKLQYSNFFLQMADGIILCKIINLSTPGTIDERAINMDLGTAKRRFHIIENQTLALNSAQAIGCNVVNIGPDELAEGNREHLVLGLTWQIIRIGLFSKINLRSVPELACLLEEREDGTMETLQELMNLPPETILLRWFNYHLRKGHEEGLYVNKDDPENEKPYQIKNFGSDISDSEKYMCLLKRIAPEYRNDYHNEEFQRLDNMKRAEMVLDYASQFKCRKFVKPNDIVTGNTKLNMAFVAHLFNTCPGLTLEPGELGDMDDLYIETEEELSIRNWMNSMGVEPYVNNIYVDCSDSFVLFQLFDKIRPNIVDWKNVYKPDACKGFGGNMKVLHNGNYALDLSNELKFKSLGGTQGSNIRDGDRTLVLGIVWQMMRAYTFKILQDLSPDPTKPITDKQVIDWANEQLTVQKGAFKFNKFSDQIISTSLPVLHVVEKLKPRTVDFKLVQGTAGEMLKDSEKTRNAQYALSMARKIGAHCYALPTDLVGLKTKMIMTVFACLMELHAGMTDKSQAKK